MILVGSLPSASQITGTAKPDPLLDGGDTASCLAGADYAPGMAAAGTPVVPADVGAHDVPVPDEITVPIGGAPQGRPGGRRNPAIGTGGAYASLDGRRLAPLLNPKPCTP